MADFQWILPRISVGAALQPADLPYLQAQSISHVVDATMHDDSAFLASPFVVLFGDIQDDGQPKGDWFKRMAPWFLAAWAVPRARFLCHCDVGVNRGPSSAYMALRLLGWPRDAALSLIHTARPVTVNGIRYAGDADQALAELGYA